MTRPLPLLLLGCLCLAKSLEGEDSPRPNVVLIISDDQAWTDYGFMGHPHIRTPHLDRLARESAWFPRGYLPAAVCRPSLASMITGLYPHEHGITGNDVALPADRKRGWRALKDPDYMAKSEALISKIDKLPTIPRLLGQKGYVSFQSGKWWEGNFQRGGFTDGMTHGDPKRGGRHGDEGLRIGREGMKPIFDFIDGAGDKPFFIWYAPFLPHTPHNPPERLLDKYRAPDRPQRLAKYYAMCEWFDESCGELLGFLEKRELTENTIVIYVCDNGWIQRTPGMKLPKGWRTSFAPRSKQSPHDGGARSPMMIRWPGRVKPGRRETLVSSLDIAPTVFAACGVQTPKRLRGESWLEICAGKAPARKSLFGELYAHDIADIDDPSKSLAYRWCVSGKWKIIRNYPGKLGRYRSMLTPHEPYPQLYDLSVDPLEKKNLAAAEPEVLARLSRELDDVWNPKSE